jgi:hypothetical protein
VTVLQAAQARITAAKVKLEEVTSALQKGISIQKECGVVLTSDGEGVPCTEDGQPCEPLVPLWNAERDAKSVLTAAESELASCKRNLADLTSRQNEKWCKTQLYWTKGLASTGDRLRALMQAGIPIIAAVHLHSAAHLSQQAEPVDGEDPLIYQTIVAEHETAAWDDSILQVAVIDVLTGKGGGQFVRSEENENTEKGAKSNAVEGSLEMVQALKRLEECLPSYRRWKTEHSLLQLPEVAVELGQYKNLLETVPQEQQSVAVVLHCVVEQVACSSNGIASGSAESTEVRQGLQLMNSVLQNMADPELQPLSVPTSHQHVATVVEGDLPQMANHGILTGLVSVVGKQGTVLLYSLRFPVNTPAFQLTSSCQQGACGCFC